MERLGEERRLVANVSCRGATLYCRFPRGRHCRCYGHVVVKRGVCGRVEVDETCVRQWR